MAFDSREIVNINNLSTKFVIYVNAGGDDPLQDINMDVGAESSRYIHMRVEN
jgi:hypothetical protein